MSRTMQNTTIRALRYAQAIACSCIMVFSTALIVSAIVLRGIFSKYNAFLYYYGTVMTSYVIIGSTISIIIAIWGCYLSYKRVSVPMFSSILSLNLMAHVALSVLYISFLGRTLSESVELLFDEQFLIYTENPQPVDYAQISLKCCGKHQALDWFTYLSYLPASCCPDKLNNETIGCSFVDFPVVNHNGCIKELETYANPNLELIIALFLGLQISEILTLAISCWFCWQILQDRLSQSINNEGKKLSHPQEVTHL